MPSLKEKLTAIVSNAFEAAGFDPALGEVVVSQRPDLGQFQCNGALPAAKQYKQNPRQIAQVVLDHLSEPNIFSNLSLAGPGFINITLTDDYLAQHTREIATDERLSSPLVEEPRTVVIDYGSPNVAKPMHVGQLRTSVIGESLRHVYQFRGDHVIGDNHLGDWGLQMGMLIYEIGQRMPDLPYFDPNYTGPYPDSLPLTMDDFQVMYPSVSARSEADPAVREAVRQATVELQQGRPGYRALWQKMMEISNANQSDDFNMLGIEFDYVYGESHYHDMIPHMLAHLKEEGHVQRSEGALVIPLLPEDGREIAPLMLVKSDGGYGYGTTDLATVILRVNQFKADLVLYVIDQRQSYHLTQVFLAAKQAGLAPNTELVHVGFGTVNGPDGKPFKTREGGLMPLRRMIDASIKKAYERMAESGVATEYDEAEQRDIAQKVGIATLKYADLMNDRLSGYIFDLEQFSRFEGKTGPYLLYTAVRIKSILRKAAEASLTPGELLPPIEPVERDLMPVMARFPEAVKLAYDECSPKHLCDFAYDLAQVFNQFYNKCHILSESNAARQASWLALLELCLKQLEQTLLLLGIETPERM